MTWGDAIGPSAQRSQGSAVAPYTACVDGTGSTQADHRSDGSMPSRGVVRMRSAAAAGAVALLPVVVYAVAVAWHARDHAMLGGDLALLEMGTRSAFGFDAELGPYSRFGWNHPGPMLFYWFAPFYFATGQSIGGLGVAAVTLLLTCIVAIVATAARVVGRTGAWVAAFLVVAFVAVTGTAWFDNMWNPTIVVAPVIVAGVTAAAVFADRPWFLPGFVLAASFSVQTHIGAAPAVGVFALVALAGAIAGLRRDLDRFRRPIVASVLLTAALWAVPAQEQLTATPGNVSQIITSTGEEAGANQSLGDILDVSGAQLTFTSVDVLTDALAPQGEISSPLPWTAIWLAVVLGAAVWCTRWNARRGQRFEAALTGSGALAAVVLLASFSRVSGDLRPYLTFTALSVGFVLHLGLILSAASWLRSSGREVPTDWIVRSVAAASLMLAASVVVRGSTDSIVAQRADARGAPAAMAELQRSLPVDSTISIAIDDFRHWPDAALVANELERAGSSTTTLPNALWMFGDERSSTGCEHYRLRFGPNDVSGDESIVIGDTAIRVERLSPPATCRLHR